MASNPRITKRTRIMEDGVPAKDASGRVVGSNDISYEVSADKVVATLRSYDSQSYTKLAKKVEEIASLEKQVKILKEEVKSETREKIADLFAAEDVVRTRVVDTCSFIMTLSKQPKETETFKYAKILEELEKSLTPELITLLGDLKSKFKSTTQKEPSLSIAKKEVSEGVWDSLVGFFAKFKNAVTSWASRYDAKLDALKAEVGITETAQLGEYNSPTSPYDRVGKDFQPVKNNPTFTNSGDPIGANTPELVSTWKTEKNTLVHLWTTGKEGDAPVVVNSRGERRPLPANVKNIEQAEHFLANMIGHTKQAKRELALESDDGVDEILLTDAEFDQLQGLTEDAEDMYPMPETLDDDEVKHYLKHWDRYGRRANRDTTEGRAFIDFGFRLKSEAKTRGLI